MPSSSLEPSYAVCPPSLQAFYLVHVCSMPLFFVAVIVHDIYMAYGCLPLVLLYCLDRAFRTWQHHTNATHVSVADGGLAMHGNVLTLRTLWAAEVGWRSAPLLGTCSLSRCLPISSLCA